MSAESIIQDFRKLPTDQQVRLLEALWDDIAGRSADLPLTEWQRQLIDDRLREHGEQPDDVEPWQSARDEVLGEL